MSQEEPVRARLRRWNVANATYYITAVTKERQPLFVAEDDVELLRTTMHAAKTYHPYHMLAYAILPDHLHLLLRLRDGCDISKLMKSIQQNYTRNYKQAHRVLGSLSLWQRGFYDHVIRDERDLQEHVAYIHGNPVKHGLVAAPEEYPYTSYHEFVRRGWY